MGSIAYSETSKRIESISQDILTERKKSEIIREASQDVSEDMEDSSFSSFYSSFLKTDCSSIDDGIRICHKESEIEFEKNRTRKPWRRIEPPWLDNVDVTTDLVYNYQIKSRDINDVLKSDLKALKHIHQVNFFKTINKSNFNINIFLVLHGE